MKILRESKKEKLPISYITAFISKGWDEIGGLKAELQALSDAFIDIEQVESNLNYLIDAYLVCIGSMENLLKSNNELVVPSGEPMIDDGENAKLIEVTPKEDIETESDAITVFNNEAPMLYNSKDDGQEEEKKQSPEAFEFYCDFD